jgi:eukaryotic-like serine/threonine-protein kinase
VETSRESDSATAVSRGAKPNRRALRRVRPRGRFKLRQHLVADAYGDLWMGADWGRPVAIRVLPRTVRSDAVLREGLRDDLEGASAAAGHPNIASASNVVLDGPSPFLVIDVPDGRVLADRFEQDPTWSADEALRIAADAAVGVAHAHSGGHAHGSLGPESIWLSNDGSVKIINLGLWRLAAGTSDPPPPPAPADDVRAIASLLLRMLLRTPEASLMRFSVGDDAAAWFRDAASGLPAPVVESLDAAMAEEPAKRPPAGVLAESLRAGAQWAERRSPPRIESDVRSRPEGPIRETRAPAPAAGASEPTAAATSRPAASRRPQPVPQPVPPPARAPLRGSWRPARRRPGPPVPIPPVPAPTARRPQTGRAPVQPMRPPAGRRPARPPIRPPWLPPVRGPGPPPRPRQAPAPPRAPSRTPTPLLEWPQPAPQQPPPDERGDAAEAPLQAVAAGSSEPPGASGLLQASEPEVARAPAAASVTSEAPDPRKPADTVTGRGPATVPPTAHGGPWRPRIPKPPTVPSTPGGPVRHASCLDTPRGKRVPATSRRVPSPPRGSPSSRARRLTLTFGSILVGGAVLAMTIGWMATTEHPADIEGPHRSPATSATPAPAFAPPGTLEATQVPQMAGISAAAARISLARVGLVLSQVVPTLGEPGVVIRSEPPPGALVRPGSAIVLFVGAEHRRLDIERP